MTFSFSTQERLPPISTDTWREIVCHGVESTQHVLAWDLVYAVSEAESSYCVWMSSHRHQQGAKPADTAHLMAILWPMRSEPLAVPKLINWSGNFLSVDEAGCLVLWSGLRGVIIWRCVCVCLLVFHLCMHTSVSFSVSLPLASSTPSASCSTMSLPAPRRPLQRVQSWLRINTGQNGHSLLVNAGRFF